MGRRRGADAPARGDAGLIWPQAANKAPRCILLQPCFRMLAELPTGCGPSVCCVERQNAPLFCQSTRSHRLRMPLEEMRTGSAGSRPTRRTAGSSHGARQPVCASIPAGPIQGGHAVSLCFARSISLTNTADGQSSVQVASAQHKGVCPHM